jgi:hypothetical protein
MPSSQPDQSESPVTPTDLTPLANLEEATFFIKYEPEIAEKLSNLKNTGVSVSGRCLSIVFSRMLYWSRYAKHRDVEKKLYFWKSQKELGEETGFSEKQINRALKELVNQGLLIRQKLHKKWWRQVYFYHVPISPFTKELDSRRSRPMGRATSNRPIHAHTPPVAERAPRPPAGARRPGGGLPSALGAAQAPVAAPRARRIDKPLGFQSMRSIRGNVSREDSTSKKQTSRSPFQNIMQRCEFYGTAENYERIFGKIA